MPIQLYFPFHESESWPSLTCVKGKTSDVLKNIAKSMMDGSFHYGKAGRWAEAGIRVISTG